MFVDMRRIDLDWPRSGCHSTRCSSSIASLPPCRAPSSARGGRPNQFVGDGILALFGLGTDPATACRQAITAIAHIAANIEQLNRDLAGDLREAIRYGIGVNGGEVIIGDIGYREHMVFTALGDPVNVAARLQDMTKGLGFDVVIAERVSRWLVLPPIRPVDAGSADSRP